MISSPRLYAVVDRSEPKPAHRQNLVELKREKFAELETKKSIDRAAQLLDRLEARAEHFAKEIARLQQRKKLAEARGAYLEEEILARMAAAKCSSAPGFHVTFTARPAPAALDVTDESIVPREYLREKITIAVDKNAAKAAIARGEDVPGCRLTQKISLIRS